MEIPGAGLQAVPVVIRSHILEKVNSRLVLLGAGERGARQRLAALQERVNRMVP